MSAICALLCACGSAPGSAASSGAVVFRQSCSGCHTLVGNESRRTQGGDLLGYALTRDQLLGLIREMPVRHALNPAQVQAVTDYVLRAQRRTTGSVATGTSSDVSAAGHQLTHGRLGARRGAAAGNHDRSAD